MTNRDLSCAVYAEHDAGDVVTESLAWAFRGATA